MMKSKMNRIAFTAMPTLMMLFFLLFAGSVQAVAKPQLSDMRIGQKNDKTRVVFDLKNLNNYKVSQLSNPSRLVIDFYKTQNNLSFAKKIVTDSRLFKVRVSQNKKRVRVVLDLHKHSAHNTFALPKNKAGFERLVVDLQDRNKNKSVAKKTTVKKELKKPALVSKSKPVSASKRNSNLVLSERNTPKGSLKINEATRSLLNKESLVFSKPKTLVVAIDAGHGGKDSGAIGANRIQEKVVTLMMAKELKRLIDRQPGMRAVLTRDKDVFIPLRKRVEIAKKKNADIFISIHADAFHDHSIRGGSVYILSQGGASSVMARLLAKSENASLQNVQLKGREDDVAFALSDLTREANIRTSRKLAKTVLGEMQKKVKMHKHSVQSAGFAVLKSIDMPSLLIETAFISNPHEARKLVNKKFQRKMASAIVNGLSKFVEHNAQKPRWGETLYVHYKVQRGDTLSQIAENHQISTKELKKLNKIRNANELYVGKKVKIPLSENVIANNTQKPRKRKPLYAHYKVQRGDTLSQIAENHKVSTKELKKLNKIRNANELHVGKKIKVPLPENVIANNTQKPHKGKPLYVYYKVQRGDTLSQIAENHQVSTKELKKLNKIRNANELYVGKKVKIPQSEKIIATL